MYYGTPKTIPGYAPYVGDQLFKKGSSVTSLGYSQYYEDVYTVGNSIIVPSYSAYGSNVYLAGSSETYYNGDGNTGYLRGSSVSVTRQGSEYNATVFRSSSSGTYRNVSNVSNALYYGGSSATYYQGNGGYIAGRGDTITVTRLGSRVTGLYSKGDSTVYTLLGDKVTSTLYTRNTSQDKTYTVIGDEVDRAILYVRDDTLDDNWVKASNKCSLNLASFVTRDVTALTV